MSHRIILSCALLALFGLAASKLVNITVDDSSPASQTGKFINYTGHWNDGLSCQLCAARPNTIQLVDGTWHDSSFEPGQPVPTATLQFTGANSCVPHLFFSRLIDSFVNRQGQRFMYMSF